MINHLRLGVNIDHVATIRNARGGAHPDPMKAALIAELAGADGITAHLREDRRHISDNDIKRLRENLTLPLNLEMAATDEMLAIALKNNPHACCIVPEKRQEITTEGGLDIKKIKLRLAEYIKELHRSNIKVSLFLEPNLHDVEIAKEVDADIIEFHTGKFCILEQNDRFAELKRIKEACVLASNLGLESHAGHGLDYLTAREISKIPEIKELNIGHFLIGEAIFLGLDAAIRKMRKVIDEARSTCSI